jgi:predicted AAA+ superfamily ATPase
MMATPRRAEDLLKRMLRTFPAVLVLGPRQCGKTTMVKRALPEFDHFDLEKPEDLGRIAADPARFFDLHPRRIAIDEAQRLPGLFSVLRPVLDSRSAKGRIVLTGSASPELVRGVSESLAGRVGVVQLTPFLEQEVTGTRYSKHREFYGGFPPLVTLGSNDKRRLWLESYIQLFLERDLPALGLRLPAARMRLLWTMLTHVHGNILNMSDLSRSLGISVPTVQANLDVLEHTFMIRRLPPFFANIQKRLTKSPKVYIRDTGLLHYLAGLPDEPALETWDRRGASFEGLVIEELIGRAQIDDPGTRAYFWSTHGGGETDLLLVARGVTTPIEIKRSQSLDVRELKPLRQCMADLGLKRGVVIYRGKKRMRLTADVDAVPWDEVRSGGDL